jgi:hypothetical protein
MSLKVMGRDKLDVINTDNRYCPTYAYYASLIILAVYFHVMHRPLCHILYIFKCVYAFIRVCVYVYIYNRVSVYSVYVYVYACV